LESDEIITLWTQQIYRKNNAKSMFRGLLSVTKKPLLWTGGGGLGKWWAWTFPRKKYFSIFAA
jgi:hypothetical protein